MFLKLYLPIDVLHALWNVAYDTYNKKIWEVIDFLFKHFDEIQFEERKINKIKIGNKYVVGVVDATECYIERPMENQREVYSGYKKRHTYKYTIVCIRSKKVIIFVDGPYNGPMHDI